MLVSICSVKGAPGSTSTALALAAVWPRPVVLVEADPAGGDLAYRCRAAVAGGPVFDTPSLLTLAAAVRGGRVFGADAVPRHAQLLACGVQLVQGGVQPAQGRGLASMWPAIAQACAGSHVDVIADLGRIDRASAILPLAEAADCVVSVTSTSLEAVVRLREGVRELAGALNAHRAAVLVPVIVGADTHAERDRAQLDELLARAGLPVEPSRHLPYDLRALARLEGGEQAGGRLGRTLLIRAARGLAETLVQRIDPAPAPTSPGPSDASSTTTSTATTPGRPTDPAASGEPARPLGPPLGPPPLPPQSSPPSPHGRVVTR